MKLLKVLALIVLITVAGVNAHAGDKRDQSHDYLRMTVVEKCAVDQNHPICKMFGWTLDRPVTNTQDHKEGKSTLEGLRGGTGGQSSGDGKGG